MTCFGNESKLEKCSHWTWGEHNCDHSEDVGVICSNSDTSQIERHVKKPQMMNNSDVTTDTSYPIYPTSCGLRKNSIFSADTNVHFRVVQGSKAKVGDFPWQVSLVRFILLFRDIDLDFLGLVLRTSSYLAS